MHRDDIFNTFFLLDNDLILNLCFGFIAIFLKQDSGLSHYTAPLFDFFNKTLPQE